MNGIGRIVHSRETRRQAMNKPVAAFEALGRPENLADEIAQQLRDRILKETLSPGQRLPTEQALGAQFGVSRNVVREAIARLKLTGLVETRHGVGTFVKRDLENRPFEVEQDDLLDFRQLIDVYRLRVEIESGAAALAATHRSQAQLDALKQTLRQGEQPEEDWEAGVNSAVDFHLAIAQASNNPYFGRIMGHISSVLRDAVRTLRFRSTGTARIKDIQREHERIVDAIERQDSNAARAAMREHLEQGINGYRNLFGD
jgi:GntR family transcriptional regulator, transcriptional repressor for pyruvate dehydrogenase complex